jgi:hypothetical protein
LWPYKSRPCITLCTVKCVSCLWYNYLKSLQHVSYLVWTVGSSNMVHYFEFQDASVSTWYRLVLRSSVSVNDSHMGISVWYSSLEQCWKALGQNNALCFLLRFLFWGVEALKIFQASSGRHVPSRLCTVSLTWHSNYKLEIVTTWAYKSATQHSYIGNEEIVAKFSYWSWWSPSLSQEDILLNTVASREVWREPIQKPFASTSVIFNVK